MAGKKRITKELRDLMSGNDLNRNHFCIEMVNDSTEHIIAKILGPPDTPYQNGVFSIDITIPDKYPFEPPVCKFITKVWHPNISSATGAICLDILKGRWAVSMTLESLIRSLQSFLESPVPNDPQDAVVGNQYRASRQLYDKTAKYWTYWYAMSDDNRKNVDRNEFKDFEEKIDKFVKKTKAPTETALTSLSCSHWNLNDALRSYNIR
ncbi:unnamed protein product [Oppiella nova]|uniref:UBC core domain-containing protein n=1 Tax=Oppiella nova TaxID=334625 RepID=A0A7R9MA38_9ACAR|nr:unnamed protein product [Oppiella nova]CAG2173413.1 unnamed protein product [Oppiella nova]